MSRNEVFSAVRAARADKTFSLEEVAILDDALDRLGVPRDHGRAPSAAITAYVRGVEKLEKLRPDGRVEAYLPTPDDVPTIGYGSTGPDIKMGTIWTVAQCEARFASSFAAFSQAVDRLIDDAPTTQGQFDACVSLAYNIGIDAFGTSTLLRLHKAGDYAGAAAQFARWNRQKGKVLNGLIKRREVERQFYEYGRVA